MRLTSLTAALAATTCLIALAAPAQAQDSAYEIPRGSLKSAVDAFSRQSGRPVIYRAQDLEGHDSRGYRGVATPERALMTLLQGTGLGSRQGEAGAIAIVRVGHRQAMSYAPPADPQTTANAPEQGQPAGEIVVTGFRQSLNTALDIKRRETAAIDSIVAEDVGKFPDANLAESMQRIPGVALSRGDGGEGRNISVRGLGAAFTRVRINGMEGTSQTGASDIYGAGNTGRSFDFNVFPTEIFSSLAVRKTPSADMEEGSLGATVDLKAPHPLDYRQDFVLSATVRGVYNDVSESADPRASLLVSKKFGDGSWGVLGSLAYQNRHLREVGYSAVDILSANTNGYTQNGIVFSFCTPAGGFVANGVTYDSPTIGYRQRASVAASAIGSTAANCSTNNPRTSTQEAYAAIFDARRESAPDTPGSGAFLPRVPRYQNSEQDAERVAGTFTLQFKPDSGTDLSLDLLYTRFEVERRDNNIGAVSFGRSITNVGQPATSIRDVELDENGSLVYGLFDGVDLTSAGVRDRFTTEIKQANFNVDHQITDALRVTALFGLSRSVFASPERLQTFIDSPDSRNYSLDFRDGRTSPIIGYGIDVADPANFAYTPALADGTVYGGFSTAGRPLRNETDNGTAEVNLAWEVSDRLTLKAGGQYRFSDFTSQSTNLDPAFVAVQTLPAGTSLASILTTIDGLDDKFGNGAPASWVAVDFDKWKQAVGFDDSPTCGLECGAASSRIRERVGSGYVMGTFRFADFAVPVRGDIGLRYVHTDQLSVGYIPVPAPTGSQYPVVGLRGEVVRSYENWLPSTNIVFELQDDLLLRVSAAKVMSRPELGILAPTSGVTATTRLGNVNNPYLDPIRANTLDAGLEWYFRPGSLLSVAFFYKDIKTYIQRVTQQVPFTELGLPAALLDNTNTTVDEIFTVGRYVNTEGGPLKGVEVNLQLPFTFLDGALDNFGLLANYTRVVSQIDYVLNATDTVTADLIDLSRNTASGTLFYDDGRLQLRSTASFRDKFIRAIPVSPGSDLRGTPSTIFVDASASYDLTDNLKLIVEAQNLTDEHNVLFVDSTRQDTLYDTRNGRTISIGANVKF